MRHPQSSKYCGGVVGSCAHGQHSLVIVRIGCIRVPAICLEVRSIASLYDKHQGAPRSWYRRTTFPICHRTSAFRRHPPFPAPITEALRISTACGTCARAQDTRCGFAFECNVRKAGWHTRPRGVVRPARQWTSAVRELRRWVLELGNHGGQSHVAPQAGSLMNTI